MKFYLLVIAGLLGWFSIASAQFTDELISIDLAPSPINGDCLTTDGTNNVWGSCGTGGGGTDGNWIYTPTGNYVRLATSTSGALVNGSSTMSLLTTVRSTSTNATTTGNFTSLGSTFIGTLNGIIKATNGLLSAATAGVDYENPLTFSDGLNRAVNAINCVTATWSVKGCLSTTDYAIFQNKISSSSLSFTDSGRIDGTYTGSTGVITADIVNDSVTDTQLAFNTGQNLTTVSDVTFSEATTTGFFSTVASSTASFMQTLLAKHATSSSFFTNILGVGSDNITDLTGTGLVNVSGVLTVNNNALATTSLSATSPLNYSATVFSINNDGIGDTQLAFNTGQNLTTVSDVTFSEATTTAFFSTVASSTLGFVTNLLASNGTSTNWFSSVASSTSAFTQTLLAKHATTTSLFTSVFGLGSDTITDLTGTGLTVSSGALTADCVAITGSADLCDGSDGGGGGGTDANWTYNNTGYFLRPSTTTLDFVLGGSATATAQLHFATTSNRLRIGVGQDSTAAFVSASSSRFASTTLTASTTLANATTSTFAITSLLNCDTVDTDANGTLKCGTDASGGGGSAFGQSWELNTAGELAPTTTRVVTVNSLVATGTATSTFTGGLQALGANITSFFTLGVDTIRDITGVGLSIVGDTLACTTATWSVFGCLSTADYAIFQNKISSTSLSWTDSSQIDGTYTSGTGVFTASVVADSIGDTQLAFNTGQNLTTTSDVTFSEATTTASFAGVASSTQLFANSATTTTFFSQIASSTRGFFTNLLAKHATTTDLAIGGTLTFNGVTGTTWASFCTTITGGSGLCDGSDDGSGGTSTTTATSSPMRRSTLQGWTFPDAQQVNADIDKQRFHTIKPIWFETSATGTQVIRHSGYGTFAYTAANAEFIRRKSTEQFVTSSGNEPDIHVLTASASLVNAATSTLINFATSTGFTGIELDWEGFGTWTQKEYENYIKFVRTLSIEAHKAGLKTMIYLPTLWNSTTTSSGTGDEWDSTNSQNNFHFFYEDLNDVPVDYIVIPVYDYQFDYSTSRPNAPLAWQDDVIRYAKSKIKDHNRLVIGIPSAGFSGVTATYLSAGLTYDDATLVAGYSGRTRDAESAEETWTNGGNSYWICDDVCVDTKRLRAEQLGINRVSLWHIGENRYGTGYSEPTLQDAPTDRVAPTFTGIFGGNILKLINSFGSTTLQIFNDGIARLTGSLDVSGTATSSAVVATSSLRTTFLTSQSCVGTDANGFLQAGTCGGSGGTPDSKWSTSTASTTSIHTGGATRVGIGTTSPYASLSITNTSGNPSFMVEDSDPDTSPFTIFSDGNISIGSLSNNSLLNIVGSSNDTAWANHPAEVATRFRNNDSTNGNWIPFIFEAADGTAAGGMEFSVDNHTSHYGRMVFEMRGTTGYKRIMDIVEDSVGIGTTSPFAKLSVTGKGTGLGTAFAVANSANITQFSILDNGNVNMGNATATTFFASLASTTNFRTGGATSTQLAVTNLISCDTIDTDANGSFRCGTDAGGGGGSPSGADGTIQYNNGGSFGGMLNTFWDDVNNRIGFGSTTPWAKFAINYDTTSEPLFLISTSSASTSQMFSVSATTSILAYAGSVPGVTPESGVRVGVGLADYQGFGGLLDQFVVRGRFNTEDWLHFFCDGPIAFATLSADTVGCGNFIFNEDATATLVPGNNLIHGGVPYMTLQTVLANDGANFSTVFSIHRATSTPVLEVNARIINIQNATSSYYAIGFATATPQSSVLENIPATGCYFVAFNGAHTAPYIAAGANAANWNAVCGNSGTYTVVDTGIASSTVTTGTGGFSKFRVEMDSASAHFYIRNGNANAMRKVATISTNMPSLNNTTELYSQAVMGRRLGVAAVGIDISRLRVWVREVLSIR